MKIVVTLVTIVLATILVSGSAGATSNYQYKKGEYAIIHDGLAPNNHYAIASHGEGEFGDEKFHLYLTLEPAHRVATRLDGVGSDNILDTAADAFEAIWAPDSRHVAVTFRRERHVLTLLLYAIDGQTAHLLSGPDPVDEVTRGHKLSLDDYSLRSGIYQVSWIGPTRFQLRQKQLYSAGERKLAEVLGAYGKESASNIPQTTNDEGNPVIWTFVDVAIDAECEVIRGNRYRVVATKPGTPAEWQ
jgi:hypothetical protein